MIQPEFIDDNEARFWAKRAAGVSARRLGWCYHRELIARRLRDFGYGLRHWLPTSELRPIEVLLNRYKEFCDREWGPAP